MELGKANSVVVPDPEAELHTEGKARQSRNLEFHPESEIDVYSGEAALECGGSSHRFPAGSHTRNVQAPQQNKVSLVCAADADEQLL